MSWLCVRWRVVDEEKKLGWGNKSPDELSLSSYLLICS